jgi:hypothetical protein
MESFVLFEHKSHFKIATVWVVKNASSDRAHEQKENYVAVV